MRASREPAASGGGATNPPLQGLVQAGGALYRFMHLDFTPEQKALRREIREYYRELFTPELSRAFAAERGIAAWCT